MSTSKADLWTKWFGSEGPSQAVQDPMADHPVPLPTPIQAGEGEVTILPYPYPLPGPGAEPGETIGSPGRVLIVAGTEGDDVLTLPTGAAASGGAGADTFVLVSAGEEAGQDGPERLGVIFDFEEGDRLDLSQLAEHAAIVGRGADIQGGAERVSIDYDGDGDEDGYVLLASKMADIGEYYPMPMPEPEGEFTILPFPMPGDDGVFTILPFPLRGEAVSESADGWIAA